ncbi:lytic transglycosylase domain-containing protein [Algirhabdus cladophorae]|uniref:lytic transglycosylase domain-containing protein n=1 Tax=Algirhabdus cladophorae TaxID=3377108 RepID=UPI003B84548B
MKRSLTYIPFALGLIAALCAPMAVAEAPKPFPDFTFKRVKPPSKLSKNKITVQVAPQVVPVVKPAPDAGAPKNNAPVLEWFWNDVSPDMSHSRPGRLREAVLSLQNGQMAAPRLQGLQGIAANHGIDILIATIGKNISPAMVLAVISVESGGRADAVSSAGAQGLMQLMPATAERFGVTDPLDPKDNIKGGVAYLDWLMTKFDGDPILALAGYNAGENAVIKNAGVPNYAETRGYVPKVLAAWTVARGLCVTPPELATDGCVFAVKGTK